MEGLENGLKSIFYDYYLPSAVYKERKENHACCFIVNYQEENSNYFFSILKHYLFSLYYSPL